MKRNSLLLAVIMLLGLSTTEARENPKKKNKKSAVQALAEGCAPATSSVDLNINNIRARMLGSGDMWWDLNDAQYEVPKGSRRHSMFAGALWLGGIDDAGQLKLAAMTYRRDGVDYWPGPLDENAAITSQICEDYNRHWLIYKEEVETHAAWIDCKEDPNCDPEDNFPDYAGNVPQSIIEWPGNGKDGELPDKLAPYFESGQNGTPGFYDWEWDYPGYDLNREFNCQLKEVDLLYGDQTVWWVYNDKGNIHTESQAGALGFEIRAQAFAFTSNDEINNMTFNNYRILNKSTFRLTDTYFSTWFDPDVGNPFDDIIGCNIPRGLGYCYNGDLDDEGPNGYGTFPPAIGFDFFQGPFADYFDGKDNDRDGCIDGIRNELTGQCDPEDQTIGRNERIIMSGFMYYNNGGTGGLPQPTTDPDIGEEFYNLMRSRWKNGSPLIEENPSGQGNAANGDGFVASGIGTPTLFAYPGLSFDTTGNFEPSAPLDWWESPQNQADKRGLHCAGPFSLAPGALNFITTGTVWARNFGSQDLFASVDDVIIADDKAQQLFDNCFQILDGPDSPVLEIVELDRKLVFKLTDAYNSSTIGYEQIDPLIAPDPDWNFAQIDSARRTGYFSYRFEGFQVFQVENANVSVDNLYDSQQSRLIFQCDIENDIDQLINYTVNPDLEGGPLVPQDMTLEANNSGIELSFTLTEDAFATGDRTLVNEKEYYFYIVAYAQNQYIKFDPRSQGDDANAQKLPFLAGRDLGNGQRAYLGIPHRTQNRFGGTQLGSDYGDGLPITRLEGTGNSGNFLRLTDETREAIVLNGDQTELDYEAGSGPVTIRVADPFEVKDTDFRLEFDLSATDSTWTLYEVRERQGKGDTILATSPNGVSFRGEYLVDNYGISILVTDQDAPGNDTLGISNNGIIGGEIVFADPVLQWLTGVQDNDNAGPQNWILAGSQALADENDDSDYNDFSGDNFGAFETILNGTWAPMFYTSNVNSFNIQRSNGIRPSSPTGGYYPIELMPNIDLVITPDHTKWTRSPVIEMGEDGDANKGGKFKFALRSDPSLILQPDGSLVEDPTSNGWSYFPGYAVDVETGKRLNITFGESSWLKSENGDDMLWNPSDNLARRFDFALGGMHTIYIHRADTATISISIGNDVDVDMSYKGDNIDDHPLKRWFDEMNNPNPSIITGAYQVFRTVTWASVPLVSRPEFRFNDYRDIPTEVRVSLRMEQPYRVGSYKDTYNGQPTYTFSTTGFEADLNNREVAENALDDVRVVPNPYYGSSAYEDSQLDNIVKITNLPDRCNISIFMTNGTLVRTINKDNTLPFVEWDLRNDFNVPIASGIYLIHIDAGPIGETVVKWMGSLRPVDLNAF